MVQEEEAFLIHVAAGAIESSWGSSKKKQEATAATAVRVGGCGRHFVDVGWPCLALLQSEP